MIDIKLLEKKTESGPSYYDEYKSSLQKRGASLDTLEEVMALNAQRKKAITESETVRAEQNKLAQAVGQMKREGKDASSIVAEAAALGEKQKAFELRARDLDEKVQSLLATFPKIRAEEV